jgi:hypothetical protein
MSTPTDVMTRLELARRHARLQERVDQLRATLKAIADDVEIGRLGMAQKAQAALERDDEAAG